MNDELTKQWNTFDHYQTNIIIRRDKKEEEQKKFQKERNFI